MEIKVLPRDDIYYHKKIKNGDIANIVIGICDIEYVKTRNNNNKQGGFWMNSAYFGYGYAGYSGKKLDGNNRRSQSQSYGNKYCVGDIITMIMDNGTLLFNKNNDDNKYGIAFNIDKQRRYVLAVAFCNDHYDVQIYD